MRGARKQDTAVHGCEGARYSCICVRGTKIQLYICVRKQDTSVYGCEGVRKQDYSCIYGFECA